MPIRKNAPMGFADVVLDDLGSTRISKLLARLADASGADEEVGVVDAV